MRLFELLNVNAEHRRQARGNGAHFIAEMDPKKFLELTTGDELSARAIMQDAQGIDDYNRYADEGSNILMPFLDVSDEKVVGHEGRHRAASLINAGHDKMPVAFKIKPSADSELDQMVVQKYGDFGWKYGMTFEDMPNMIKGQYGRGTLLKSQLKVLVDGNDNI